MPNKEYAVAMARYNVWQNANLIQAATGLDQPTRQKARGSFFDNIEATFAHLLWGDRIWLSRFAETPAPQGGIAQSTALPQGWARFCADRAAFDRQILKWAHGVDSAWFEGDLTWHSGALGKDVTKPKRILVLQLFNHQTHHRGQIHAMLTAAGAKPGDTDVPFMPDQYNEI
ncbi:damage-inducible protein DinB [Pseudorhodobacter turbinis]|uniref:Damage-inducible protein DinB n=1 Tax=Pseudorhodobacter turbinis TaxID=2500533 RepID=A0A4P8EGC2_9RHOB|nr:DinB family protein [Pseudorhodobacter turbinis]QCO55772.1 damage-inducible protein DinB [Pseudorhodobacter turbinis]